MQARSTLLLALFASPLLLGAECVPKGDDTGGLTTEGADGSGGDDAGGSDGTDTSTVEEMISGTISGSVTVELYTTDENGARQYISYEEGTGGAFPWDKIFVGAYFVGPSGADHYVGTDVIEGATTGPNAYEVNYTHDEDTSVYVYASLDYYADSVVGTSEPRGVYPIEIPIADGQTITDIDITILSPLPGGGGSCDTVGISGDVIITVGYADGGIAVMTADTSGQGPYYSTTTTAEEDGGGATGTYSLQHCNAYGDMQLLGCWDSDGDTMYSPADHWGAYISEPDVDGNPINIGYTDLSGYDVQIPLGDGPGLSVVPFVQIAGTVSMEGGTFDDLPPGSTVYVAALKYRPNTDLNIVETSNVYDIDTFEWSDITGQTSKDFALVVPASTIVYLWAYADTDADGLVNEVGDPIGSGGEDENGRYPTGTTSAGGVSLQIATPDF